MGVRPEQVKITTRVKVWEKVHATDKGATGVGRRVGLEKEPVAIPRQVSVCLLSGHNKWACDTGSYPTAISVCFLSGHNEWMHVMHNNPTASISMPFECDLEIPGQVSVCLLNGISSAHMGCAARHHLSCGRYQSACSTGESCPEPTQVVRPLELF